MSPLPPDPARRRLLRRTRDVSAAAAALAALGPAASVPAAAPVAAPAAKEGPRGYHETEHTRRYYELARF